MPRQTLLHWGLLIALSLLGSCSDSSEQKPGNSQDGFVVQRIAHAGGALNGLTYSNSLEALRRNYELGFRYFEIDFSETSDGHLVCMHDWDERFTQAFGGDRTMRLSFAEFNLLIKERGRYTPCTLSSLNQWMQEFPDALIVTDVKGDNLAALNLLIEALPDAKERVIPQIYQPENFTKVRNLGYVQIIWTLYRFSGSDSDVLSWISQWDGAVAITMPKYRASGGDLAKQLHAQRVPSYVHTVNEHINALRYTTVHGVSEIYTDFLAP